MIDTREQYGDVFAVYWPIGVGVFVVMTVLILAVAIRFRARGEEHEHGPLRKKAGQNIRLEAAWVLLLAGTVAFLVFLTFSTMAELDADAPADLGSEGRSAEGPVRPELEVAVTSARWNWRFDYPRFGVTLVGTGTNTPTLVVPRGDVRFDLTTLDVIHSFYIPYLRFKRDAFPGRVTRFTLGFDREGEVPGAGNCAQYCGWRHAYMDFRVRVVSPDAFRRWVLAERRRQGGA